MNFDFMNSAHRKYGRVYAVLHVVILILSLFLVVGISIDAFRNVSFITQPLYLRIQFWICMFFLFDFMLELLLAERKWRYWATHWLFLLVSIPYLNIFDYYRISFSGELGYLIRFIPLVRGGYALAIVVGWLSSSRISSLLTSYLTMLLATVYFSSLIFFVLESKINPEAPGYSDALWWAFMDVTTVGSNIYAVTPVCKILSVLLAALGMMVFPIFTVYITSVVEKANKQKAAAASQPPENTK